MASWVDLIFGGKIDVVHVGNVCVESLHMGFNVGVPRGCVIALEDVLDLVCCNLVWVKPGPLRSTSPQVLMTTLPVQLNRVAV